jgi:dolichyl-phosphate beta-glucosyltransferase
MDPYLSVIIPAFNESRRLGPTLDAAHAHLQGCGYTYEIVVVNDGSSDSTAALVEAKTLNIPHLQLITLPENKGKGAAVKVGMLGARGKVRLFMDADNSTSIEQVDSLLPFLTRGYAIVVGSRRIEGASIHTEQSPLRSTLGSIFRTIAGAVAPTGVVDTQNGFKLFTEEAANKIFSTLTTQRWSFDVEVLLLAKKHSLRVVEVPIIWTNDAQSKLDFLDMFQMLVDLLRIRARLLFSEK